MLLIIFNCIFRILFTVKCYFMFDPIEVTVVSNKNATIIPHNILTTCQTLARLTALINMFNSVMYDTTLCHDICGQIFAQRSA